MSNITDLSISDLQRLCRDRKIGPVEVVKAYLEEIDSKEPIVKAFLEVYHESSIKRARELEVARPDNMPLYGVPIALKDNICMKDRLLTCGSRILRHYRSPYNATVVKRLIEAGAVIIGKTNLDEFAMGSSTENSAFQVTKNPWNEECAPGGSSGGSAAAVASGMVPAALGSDTGGSIRQPAAFCGITGLKGTYGRVSRYGLAAFASSLDQIGPLARDVDDCALIMEVISGHDPKDASTIGGPSPGLIHSIDQGIKGMKIAIPAGIVKWEVEKPILDFLDEAVRMMRGEGATIDETALPGMETSIACYYILATAEASSNLARYDGVKYGMRVESQSLQEMYENTRGEGLGDEVQRRILLGTYVLSSGYYEAYYGKAKRVKEMIRASYGKLFEKYDLIVMPTTPSTAFRLGEKVDDPVSMYLSDIFTAWVNIAGLPAVSIPAGLSDDGLPVGIQLIAPTGEEVQLMKAAKSLERSFRFRQRFLPRSLV
ncbi:MAG: Asp-tRNA(Asn)/Glu-tRNA(Gln) amidotransferase subunit GatA [Candidatus Krumholzibacteriota bacterium]|nr:Asp-tRNA(Asn)/Glu-tRNA(Gln) amidotransferase subunit GatA [Candidatus Krumholzibacteriota bacterium]